LIAERRSEKRENTETLNSVIVRITGIPVHQFKFKDISRKGNCFIVKEDSAMLRNLTIGEKLEIGYQNTDGSQSIKIYIAEVRHITKACDGRFKGHYLIGIKIIKALSKG